MLPVLGACTAAELVLVVANVDQFPKRDFKPVCPAGCVVALEPAEVVPVGALVKPGKTDDAAVLLLVDAPNMEDVLVEEAVDAALVVARDADCPKPESVVTPPKMGLKLWTGGLLSGADVDEEEVVVVAETAKMGLNPEDSRGLVLLSDSDLLAGAGAVGAAAVTVLEAVDAEGALLWPASPNRPAAPATGGVLPMPPLLLLEALKT